MSTLIIHQIQRSPFHCRKCRSRCLDPREEEAAAETVLLSLIRSLVSSKKVGEKGGAVLAYGAPDDHHRSPPGP